ncbi:thiamine biosynthesis protein ThiI [Pelagirhabdus alkalitolerans]|uniref:Probable tRNA sulfurtransferase n=1 Tax=Pelagirhabdus alkalitolerans TaxID=1612202 RepID=A0A1G6HJ79_9BACI|nr:tRNA uracil 4-sulfurtransferase ThiI [Pelagirhabdus alkalitolerans]SDB94310.1 thiamine biosynthesis protein ThiI [Pelagirhabdus alkalitolerans]
MLYDHLLIRYGELALKDKNRKKFINQLHENVRHQLKDFPDAKVKSNRDRMMIELNGVAPSPIIERCQYIFGIQTFSLAIKSDSEEMAIKRAALFALNEADSVQTFKVTTKRANKSFPIGSQDFNYIIGSHLLKNTENIKVDVHQPDLEIHIDIRNDATYVTSERYQGMGGLPVGSSGKTLLLLSGGIDSPVAGYLAMRRGIKIEAIHFHSPPYTSEGAKQKVYDLAKQLSKYGHAIKIHVVPFTAMQQKIHRDIPFGYSMTVMRRMMLKISEIIAEKQDIKSITTGESLGQVASQTMESMHAINAITNYPIIRPLVTMDKSEIISIAKTIDTYPISIRPYDDCCTVFVPNAPKTKPKKEKVEFFEGELDLEQELNDLLDNIETVSLSPFDSDENEMDSLF